MFSLVEWFTTNLIDGNIIASASWQPITLRAAIAVAASFALALALGKPLIRILGRHLRERIVSDSPTLARLHQHKEATPTMGGLFVVSAIVFVILLLGDWNHGPLPAVALLLVGLTLTGACDDLLKMRCGKGLSPKAKLIAQTVIATAAVSMTHWSQTYTPSATQLLLPGIGGVELGLGIIPLGVLVVVGSSNAVNLTDGLDGLAGGCLAFSFAAIGAVCYVVGDANLAAICGVLHVPAAREMTIVCGAAEGAVLGFLWYNRHPARVFLGDTGSLPLGGLLGLLAVIARQELLLIVIAGVFVAEAASVMLQVGYYKLRQRRILLCAPLHHHFQFLGWPESKIVNRFWMAAALCAFLGLTALALGSRGTHHMVEVAGEHTPNDLSYSFVGAMER
ncbi:MAG: phospho-N-acetylmuramoyl-pentapeptide-transferase [Planctomycetes bacterium]|nr:phospho-N-acetylmuramoyl-pentapeptide-transferase [Planctomycetota bacterium]